MRGHQPSDGPLGAFCTFFTNCVGVPTNCSRVPMTQFAKGVDLIVRRISA
jgi:hypothetical protein